MKLIMACITGSQLYGTSRPDSDVDIRGVCLQPVKSILGLSGFEQYQPNGEEAIRYSNETFGIESDDITIYGVSKFLQLALNNNPSIIELLFVPTSHTLVSSEVWDKIVSVRDYILSTKALHSFSGYAYSQLQRMQTHYKWLHTPPDKPDPFDFGMYQVEDGGQHWKSSTMKNAYKNRLAEYNHYKEWRDNRNPKRAALEEKYTYDVKHASHLYRLALLGEELMTTGKITLPLKQEYLDIVLSVLHGEVSYNSVVELGEGLHDKLGQLESTSPLRKKPDYNVVESLLMGINLSTILREYKL